MTETRTARVGFRVRWHKAWPLLEEFIRAPMHGERVVIFPRMVLPAEHPIVLSHPEYFR